ncbi:MAG TPA: TerC/Alx family metal homeostasis membrane protein [Gammaproteobacteria bacterium]|nr:TerC/Alx family metal homeostasis membrane protein [Gammaproteobacteria bacterium]
MHNIANIWMWIGFSVFLVSALFIDTVVLGKKYLGPHTSIKASLYWTMAWIICALIFNALLWLDLYLTSTISMANQKSLEFFAGYLIEKSLSIDNLFAFYVIFHQLHIPTIYQQRIFAIGIWSAIVLRLLLILFGVWLITQFHWILYAMGVFLFFTGIKMFFVEEHEKDLAETWIIKIIKRFMRVTTDIQGKHFFISKNKLLYATPLFLGLIFIEISDIVFAFDSIPAIFAITTDPFIVWTSNIFAILGLRALYFLLAGMVYRLHMLKHGIALVLVFVGIKMLIAPWINISVMWSLSSIISILVIFSVLSVKYRKQEIIK